jgi:hypothetical protein
LPTTSSVHKYASARTRRCSSCARRHDCERGAVPVAFLQAAARDLLFAA